MTGTARTHNAESPAARQKRVWDKSASSYDKQIAFFERAWFPGGREWLGQRAHGRVLEVAIGTGRNLAHYGPDVTITGIELSPAMLSQARQRADELGRTAELHEGDAENLPFADASGLAVLATPRPSGGCEDRVGFG
jgi:ubiquinone/menaquinone biosynthesis C-methylase UbiE